MNSLLYAANEGTQTLADGQNISFGTPVRRFGKNLNLSGGNVVANGEGYYPVDANVTFRAGATGDATLQIYENGVAIPGANAKTTVSSTSAFNSLVVPTAFRIKCCEEKTITASIKGVAATVSNAGIRVMKA